MYAFKEKQNLENEKIKTQFNLSKKLAHDIRSPLSTLNLITSKIEHKEAKALQIAVIEQINTIAENLLSESKKNTARSYLQTISQLETEYSLKKNKLVHFNYKASYELNDSAPEFLYSVMSNLIQNSIEATDKDKCKIDVNISIQNNFINFSVKDNGKGIPEHILNILGSKEVTYGKGNTGNGIGFYSAKKEIESYGGSIHIESKIKAGTIVYFKLPI